MWCIKCQKLVAFSVHRGTCKCKECDSVWTYQELIILLSQKCDTLDTMIDNHDATLDE